MKDYLVEYKIDKQFYIVYAHEPKDAIRQVCEIMPYESHELIVRSIGSLHNEKGKIIKI